MEADDVSTNIEHGKSSRKKAFFAYQRRRKRLKLQRRSERSSCASCIRDNGLPDQREESPYKTQGDIDLKESAPQLQTQEIIIPPAGVPLSQKPSK